MKLKRQAMQMFALILNILFGFLEEANGVLANGRYFRLDPDNGLNIKCTTITA